jgi:hypothetical protein
MLVPITKVPLAIASTTLFLNPLPQISGARKARSAQFAAPNLQRSRDLDSFVRAGVNSANRIRAGNHHAYVRTVLQQRKHLIDEPKRRLIIRRKSMLPVKMIWLFVFAGGLVIDEVTPFAMTRLVG